MTDTTPTIDLDAARRAREEAAAVIPRIVFGGDSFELPAEMPATFAFRAQAGELETAITDLLGDDAERFWAKRPSMDDLAALVDGVGTAYGIGTSGESTPSRR